MVNQVVFSPSFGRGIITDLNENTNLFTVKFDDSSRRFLYPDAFEKHLTAEDPNAQAKAQEALQQKRQAQEEQIKVQPKKLSAKLFAKAEKPMAKPTASMPPAKTRLTVSAKKLSNASNTKNIIYKCNFCDGGATSTNIGFQGVCTQKNIAQNVIERKHTQCSLTYSSCAQYLAGELSYEELRSECPCYESTLLNDWELGMGWSQSGKPRRLNQNVNGNSLFILTTREPNTMESQRIVFAVFLAQSLYKGDGANEEGRVKAHDEYKMVLTRQQARQIFLWNYYANEKKAEEIRWGSGLTRFMSHDNAVALLSDICRVKSGQDDEALAQKFLEYFCELHGYESDNIPKNYGALNMAGN